MGKRKPYVDPDLTFAPRINETSRKLASTVSTDGVPRFMVETVSRYVSREPVFPQKSDMVVTLSSKPVVQRVSVEDELTFSPKLNETSMKIARERGPQVRMNLASRAAAVAARLAEEHTFTFHPKVSSQSVKIAESLGSDFMSRQRQHLERQKKHMEQSSFTFRAVGRLSPVNKSKKKDKASKENDRNDDDSPDDTDAAGDAIPRGEDAAMPTCLSPSTHKEDMGNMENTEELSKSKSTTELNKLYESSPSKTSLSLKRSLSRSVSPRHKKRSTYPEATATSVSHDMEQIDEEDIENVPPHISRSKTNMKLSRKGSVIHQDRIKNAKLTAERAIKAHKIFTIVGKYPQIRESLRRRGWVEKFCKLPAAPKKSKKKDQKKKGALGGVSDDDVDDDGDDDDDAAGTDDDVTDDDDDTNAIPPWEEDNGIYGIMSRLVRNYPPTFIWSVRRESVDHKLLGTEQIVNHYGKATFTTKVGLCINMRNVPWFDNTDPDGFFPRCYRLSHDEEKMSFIDDYRLTACMNVLKWIQMKHREGLNEDACVDNEENATANGQSNNNTNNTITAQNKGSSSPRRPVAKRKKGGVVPIDIADTALAQCKRYLTSQNHEDIDIQHDDAELTDAQWDEFIQNYYRIIHDGATIANSISKLKESENMINQLKVNWPQYEMDGHRNVWIIKPGAKSRGRGILCKDRLEDILALVSSTVVKKEGKYVVQKYMERPLLIYNTKFDIRQWFLVTDWNPLTVWFYKDSYLRFCSQEYTLDKFDESIHLANNAIQCHYQNGQRSSQLPKENMWSHEEFQEYLSEHGAGNAWDEIIYTGMKRAVICALLATQDIVEWRKGAFELYGADFMLTEDYRPWLIEINSSPSMSYSTKVTAILCANVLEDTMKVVLDRRYDKNCDTGQFELAYKQQQVTVPPYIGISLSVDGRGIPKPVVRETHRKNENTSNAINSENSPRVSETVSRVIQNNLSTTVSNKHAVIQNNLPPKSGTSTSGSLHRNNTSLQTKPAYVGLTVQPSKGSRANKSSRLEYNKKSVSRSLTMSQQENIGSLCPWLSEEDDIMEETTSQINKESSKKHRNETDVNERVKTPARTSSAKSTVSVSTVEIIEKAVSASKTTAIEHENNRKLQPVSKGCGRGGGFNIGGGGIGGGVGGGTVMTTDTAWAQTCSSCGGGMNLYLSQEARCHCQQDSIKIDCSGERSRSVRSGRILSARSSQTSLNVCDSQSNSKLSEADSSCISSQYQTPVNSLMLDSYDHSHTISYRFPRPKPPPPKQHVSIYRHLKHSADSRKSDRVILRYNDAVISQPSTANQIVSNTLPKLVNKYISKHQDQLPSHLDTSRHTISLSIVSNTFYG